MAPRPEHDTLVGTEFDVLLCPSCGNWDLTYVAKSGAIGCHSCGIHPDLTDEASPALSASPDVATLTPAATPALAPWKRTVGG